MPLLFFILAFVASGVIIVLILFGLALIHPALAFISFCGIVWGVTEYFDR